MEERNISAQTLEKILNALEISFKDFFDDKDFIKTNNSNRRVK